MRDYPLKPGKLIVFHQSHYKIVFSAAALDCVRLKKQTWHALSLILSSDYSHKSPEYLQCMRNQKHASLTSIFTTEGRWSSVGRGLLFREQEVEKDKGILAFWLTLLPPLIFICPFCLLILVCITGFSSFKNEATSFYTTSRNATWCFTILNW